MTKETIFTMNETQKFNHAVDLFFGMNPQRRLWLLVMLYMAKERALTIVDNCDQNDYFRVIARVLIDDITDAKVREQWKKEGKKNRCILGNAPTNLPFSLDELIYTIDVDSHNNRQENSTSIFDRHRWEQTYLVEILEILMSLSDDWYQENSSWAFDYILSKIDNRQGRMTGLLLQPKEITKLVSELLNAENGTIYNPYSGTCDYAVVTNNNTQYFGEDFNSTSWLIGNLNLLVKDRKNAICERGNVYWQPNGKYDYVISTPPFGLRCLDSQYTTADADFLARSQEYMRNKSIGVYPSSLCHSPANRNVLVRLIEEDILESVILLPSNLYEYSSLETVIIVTNKNKPNPGYVRIIDASDCYKSNGRLNTLEYDKVLERYNNRDSEIGQKDVSNKLLRSNDYNIYPKLYANIEEIVYPDGYEIFELGDLIEPCRGIRRFDENEGYLAKIAELSSDGSDCKRTVEQFVFSDNLYHSVKIEEPVILFSMVRDIKPTYCEASPNMPLYVHPNVSAYRITADWVYPEYLCYEISRRVTPATSGIIPRVSRELLLKTKLAFPSKNIEEQKLIVKESVQLSKLSKARELGLQELIDTMKAEYISEVKSRKHDTKPYFRELRSVERNMRRYVESYETMTDFKDKMSDSLNKFHTALEALSNLVNIFSEENKFGKAEAFDIDKYFRELVKNHDNDSAGFRIEYALDYDALNESGLMKGKVSTKEFSMLRGLISFKSEMCETSDTMPLIVDISPLDFERMVKNIVENAKEHGFTEPDANIYELEINLSVNSKARMFQIDFINNGNPLPGGLDKFRYGLLGEKAGPTGGSGRGGYIVKSIVEHYNGSFDVFMDGEDTVIRVLLPISKHNDE